MNQADIYTVGVKRLQINQSTHYIHVPKSSPFDVIAVTSSFISILVFQKCIKHLRFIMSLTLFIDLTDFRRFWTIDNVGAVFILNSVMN